VNEVSFLCDDFVEMKHRRKTGDEKNKLSDKTQKDEKTGKKFMWLNPNRFPFRVYLNQSI
jgi:hypothetical protein